MTYPKSKALFERAQACLPGGASRNTILRGDHPFYAQMGKGSRVIDVDGIERIDFANNMASHIHGHSFPPIVEAVTKQMQLGTAFTMATEAELSYAEHLCARSPNFEKVRFVNSGTEAVMAGMKAARAFTEKSKIAKVEGAYHGAYDYAEVSQNPGPQNWGAADHPNAVPLANGTPKSVANDMVILPFNKADLAIAILDECKEDVACILIDPVPHRVGMRAVDGAFVEALAHWAKANGALLMFDEVITFRTDYGGAQQRYAVKPDLTSMGKMIGGGFPVGALAGSNAVMQVFVDGRLPHSGTFSANPITMTAGRVAMEYFDQAAVTQLNKLGEYARRSLEQVFAIADIPASVTGAGSLLRIHLKPEPPANYRDAYLSDMEKKALSELINDLYDNGIMMIHTGSAALSTAMTQADIDRLTEEVLKSIRKLKPILMKAA